MRRRLLLALAWLPCVLCAAAWARSYWRCDVVAWGSPADVHTVFSALGGLYFIHDGSGVVGC